jgi:hypothetical protein
VGRHSAPDDDQGGELRTVVPATQDRLRPARHSRADDEGPPSWIILEQVGSTAKSRREPLAEQVTERIPEPAPPAEPAPESEAPASTSTELAVPAAKELVPVGRGNQATAADLALLREHSEVRNRVIAAVVAPFVLYTVVMYLIGAVNVYFIWVWIPLVTAGVVAGSILDAAHRRRAKESKDSKDSKDT